MHDALSRSCDVPPLYEQVIGGCLPLLLRPGVVRADVVRQPSAANAGQRPDKAVYLYSITAVAR
ncbi:hypothetical protein Aph01nite_15380 [Acrocarpospora phusangensis]|uniref:Uncharacterized protein n=1 Tax=Acrocarpospora phusangensis TaxID=1070424 RepID=A0A919Q782_9ACTN|nr:hypothetical protein Aph01nite_15380 [Acrocarpospora phusangensis]